MRTRALLLRQSSIQQYFVSWLTSRTGLALRSCRRTRTSTRRTAIAPAAFRRNIDATETTRGRANESRGVPGLWKAGADGSRASQVPRPCRRAICDVATELLQRQGYRRKGSRQCSFGLPGRPSQESEVLEQETGRCRPRHPRYVARSMSQQVCCNVLQHTCCNACCRIDCLLSAPCDHAEAKRLHLKAYEAVGPERPAHYSFFSSLSGRQSK